MNQSSILQSGDHHPQPLKIFNIRDKNVLLLRSPSNEQQQHLRVAGKTQCVCCLFNDPSWSGWHPRKDHVSTGTHQMIHLQRHYIYNLGHAPSPPLPVPPVPRIQSPNIGLGPRFSGEDETFGPPGGWIPHHHKFVGKEISLTPQSAIVPYGVPIYQNGEENNSCVLSLGRGSTEKGKEAIIVSSMVGSSNNIVLAPTRFSLLPSGVGDLGVTDNDINNVPRKNKRKRQYSNRKMSVYSFPTNVKNLLSTGIFEGVPVKYVSWSRGKTLKGVIKGTNYLCSCDRCKMSMAVNAYEFEKHAGCDTKHPNNHIYFPSGKSLYSVVQTLKAIVPNDLLFEAIRTASGTPINVKNFLAWKELYEPATNPFRRIQ